VHLRDGVRTVHPAGTASPPALADQPDAHCCKNRCCLSRLCYERAQHLSPASLEDLSSVLANYTEPLRLRVVS
jgi:hypothetical protein